MTTYELTTLDGRHFSDENLFRSPEPLRHLPQVTGLMGTGAGVQSGESDC